MICATSIKQLPRFGFSRIAIACGVFDGLHIGHRKIIRTLKEQAEAMDAVPVIVTFDPHPRRVLTPHLSTHRILSRNHKLALLKRLGIGVTVILPFTKQLSRLEPEAFIADMLTAEGLHITTFCVGKNWKFGHRGTGDVNVLKQLEGEYKFKLVPVPELSGGEEKVSSTTVRESIEQGDLGQVKKMLGRHYSIMGNVEFGKGIATSQLYCPTANIDCQNEVFLPNGIYAARVQIDPDTDSPKEYFGVIYLGNSPTFVDDPPNKPCMEINIFDFNDEIYGQLIEVEFIQFIRGDEKFESVDALRTQIEADVNAAKKVFAVSL